MTPDRWNPFETGRDVNMPRGLGSSFEPTSDSSSPFPEGNTSGSPCPSTIDFQKQSFSVM